MTKNQELLLGGGILLVVVTGGIVLIRKSGQSNGLPISGSSGSTPSEGNSGSTGTTQSSSNATGSSNGMITCPTNVVGAIPSPPTGLGITWDYSSLDDTSVSGTVSWDEMSFTDYYLLTLNGETQDMTTTSLPITTTPGSAIDISIVSVNESYPCTTTPSTLNVTAPAISTTRQQIVVSPTFTDQDGTIVSISQVSVYSLNCDNSQVEGELGIYPSNNGQPITINIPNGNLCWYVGCKLGNGASAGATVLGGVTVPACQEVQITLYPEGREGFYGFSVLNTDIC